MLTFDSRCSVDSITPLPSPLEPRTRGGIVHANDTTRQDNDMTRHDSSLPQYSLEMPQYSRTKTASRCHCHCHVSQDDMASPWPGCRHASSAVDAALPYSRHVVCYDVHGIVPPERRRQFRCPRRSNDTFMYPMSTDIVGLFVSWSGMKLLRYLGHSRSPHPQLGFPCQHLGYQRQSVAVRRLRQARSRVGAVR